jgi:hypothetical protein
MLLDFHYPYWELTLSIFRGPVSLDRCMAGMVQRLRSGPLTTWRWGWAWVADCRGLIPYPALDPLYLRSIAEISCDLLRHMPEGRVALVVDEISARVARVWSRAVEGVAALNRIGMHTFDQRGAAVLWARPAGDAIVTAADGSALPA